MTFKANGTTIVDSNRAGNFENIYYQYTANTITGNSKYSVNSSVWLTDSGNASFTMLFANTSFLEYTQAQGALYGYTSAGSLSSGYTDVIDRFPFAVATTNATNVGNLSRIKYGSTGNSSYSHGYDSAGTYFSGPFSFVDGSTFRFPFALNSSITSSEVGNLTAGAQDTASGQSSTTHGYISGGNDDPFTFDTIQRFPFAVTTGNSADVGNLSVGRLELAGQSSTTHGYISGGGQPSNPVYAVNIIDRFPFSVSTTNATDVGDATVARYRVVGQSSTTHGYISGGITGAGVVSNVTDRFPFATATTNATDVGDLTVVRSSSYSQSSVTHGYTSGGYNNTIGENNIIDRFPFSATTTNSTDVGDLTQNKAYGSSQQV